MSKKVIVISIVTAAVLAISGTVLYKSSFISTNDAVIEPDFIAVDAGNSGKVKDVFVKPDQNVTRGQLIAEIEVVENVILPEQNKDKADPAVNLKNSKAKLNEAEENYKHFAIMYKDGVIPQEDYDRSLNQLTDAQKNYENALKSAKDASKTSTSVVKTNVTTSKVYAPKDGVVSLSYINKGENAVKDKPIVLMNSNKPKVTAYFNPKFAQSLKSGQEVNIHLKKYPLKKFAGIIDSVGSEPEMDSAKQSLVIPVQITFKDELNGYTIKQGQPVQVTLKK